MKKNLHSLQHLTEYQRLLGLPQILNAIIYIAMVFSAVMVLVWSVEPANVFGASMLFLFISLWGLWFLNRLGFYQLVGLLLFLIVVSLITFNLWVDTGIYDAGIIAYPILIIFAGLIFGKRAIFLTTAVIAIVVTVVYMYMVQGTITPFDGLVQPNPIDFWTALTLIAATGVLLWLAMGIIETNLEKIIQSERKLHQAYELTLGGWAKALELRDHETKGHSNRVTDLVVSLAQAYGLGADEIEHIRRGALLHDIGKMGIPDEILLKPGLLNDEERTIIEMHPIYSMNLLKEIDFLKPALDIPGYHHERWDGKGYPQGLAGEDIPIAARLFTVIDYWDALTSDRPYRPAWSRDQALRYIKENAGIIFDSRVVDIFVNLIGELDQ
jgi:putative nucleotidyltransferase with HDIG domain